MFWIFGHEACGILAPWPGIEPTSTALENQVLTTGPLSIFKLRSWFPVFLQHDWLFFQLIYYMIVNT